MKPFTQTIRELAGGFAAAARHLAGQRLDDPVTAAAAHRLGMALRESALHLDDLLTRATPALLAKLDALSSEEQRT